MSTVILVALFRSANEEFSSERLVMFSFTLQVARTLRCVSAQKVISISVTKRLLLSDDTSQVGNVQFIVGSFSKLQQN